MVRSLAVSLFVLVSCASETREGGPGSPVQLVVPAEIAAEPAPPATEPAPGASPAPIGGE